jgi:hypothetical protein
VNLHIKRMKLASTFWSRSFTVPLLLACGGEPRSAAVDSMAAESATTGDTAAPEGTRSGWESSLGPLLVIADDQRRASAIFPNFSDSTLTDTTTFDTSILGGMRVDLFSRAGLIGHGELRAIPPRARDDGCVAWPEATVTITDSRGTPSGWTVALTAGHARSLALDSLESVAGADSARLTAEVSRLASMVPDDTAAAFHGIPYFVRQVRQFRIAPDTHGLIANVTRRINQEANPREEQLLLVAERIGSPPGARYVLAYHERVSGPEEAIESTDVLAAITLVPSGTPALVLIRDYGDGSAYALITRAAGRGWQLTWNSAYAGC